MKSFIQDPETFKLIPVDEYVPKNQRFGESAAVLNDIQPYKSMVNGEWITSRSRHRDHLKAHGCIEVGNETKHLNKPKMTPPPGLKQRIIDIANEKLRYT